jgi:hypothetical protein
MSTKTSTQQIIVTVIRIVHRHQFILRPKKKRRGWREKVAIYWIFLSSFVLSARANNSVPLLRWLAPEVMELRFGGYLLFLFSKLLDNSNLSLLVPST